MSFRGRGRGRGVNKHRGGRAGGAQAIDEGLRITVPNMPHGDLGQMGHGAHSDHAAVGLTREREANPSFRKEYAEYGSYGERLPNRKPGDQPLSGMDTDSIRITVGNDHFGERARDSPMDRLGPPVNRSPYGAREPDRHDKGSHNPYDRAQNLYQGMRNPSREDNQGQSRDLYGRDRNLGARDLYDREQLNREYREALDYDRKLQESGYSNSRDPRDPRNRDPRDPRISDPRDPRLARDQRDPRDPRDQSRLDDSLRDIDYRKDASTVSPYGDAGRQPTFPIGLGQTSSSQFSQQTETQPLKPSLKSCLKKKEDNPPKMSVEDEEKFLYGDDEPDTKPLNLRSRDDPYSRSYTQQGQGSNFGQQKEDYAEIYRKSLSLADELRAASAGLSRSQILQAQQELERRGIDSRDPRLAAYTGHRNIEARASQQVADPRVIASSVDPRSAPAPVQSQEQGTLQQDNTIENILKSIGFDFELSKRMQELARKREDEKAPVKQEQPSSFGIDQTATSFIGSGELKNVNMGAVSRKDSSALDDLIHDSKQKSEESNRDSYRSDQIYDQYRDRYDQGLQQSRDSRLDQRYDSRHPDDRDYRRVDDRDRSYDDRDRHMDNREGRVDAQDQSYDRDRSDERDRRDYDQKDRRDYDDHRSSQQPDDLYSDGRRRRDSDRASLDMERHRRDDPNDKRRESYEKEHRRDSYDKPESKRDERSEKESGHGRRRRDSSSSSSSFSSDDEQSRNKSPPRRTDSSSDISSSYPFPSPGPGYPPPGYPGAFPPYGPGPYGHPPPGFMHRGPPPPGFGMRPPGPQQSVRDSEWLHAVEQFTNPQYVEQKKQQDRNYEREQERKRLKEERKRTQEDQEWLEAVEQFTRQTQAPSKRTVLPPKAEQKDSKSQKSSADEKKKKEEETKKKTKLSDEERAKLLRQKEERQKRLQLLEKELERLKKQQNELMRKRQRQKDGHKDPLLVENSKLQEEIADQISSIRKAMEENTKALGSEEKLKAKPEKKPDTTSKSGKTEAERRSSSKTKEAPKKAEVKKEVKSDETKVKKEKSDRRDDKDKVLDIHFEYFDPGNHWCRICNHVSGNIFEVFQHLSSKKHQQKVDPYDRPWMPESLKNPSSKPIKAEKTQAAPIKGVEFLRSIDAFFCTLCDAYSGDAACAEHHLKSELHNKRYKEYIKDNPYYERSFNLDKAAGVSMMNVDDKSEDKAENLGGWKAVETEKHSTQPMSSSGFKVQVQVQRGDGERRVAVKRKESDSDLDKSQNKDPHEEEKRRKYEEDTRRVVSREVKNDGRRNDERDRDERGRDRERKNDDYSQGRNRRDRGYSSDSSDDDSKKRSFSSRGGESDRSRSGTRDGSKFGKDYDYRGSSDKYSSNRESSREASRTKDASSRDSHSKETSATKPDTGRGKIAIKLTGKKSLKQGDNVFKSDNTKEDDDNTSSTAKRSRSRERERGSSGGRFGSRDRSRDHGYSSRGRGSRGRFSEKVTPRSSKFTTYKKERTPPITRAKFPLKKKEPTSESSEKLEIKMPESPPPKIPKPLDKPVGGPVPELKANISKDKGRVSSQDVGPAPLDMFLSIGDQPKKNPAIRNEFQGGKKVDEKAIEAVFTGQKTIDPVASASGNSTEKATSGASALAALPGNSGNKTQDDDASSEASGFSMAMGSDFEVLDEVDAD